MRCLCCIFFPSNLLTLTLTYGLLGGLGCGILYTPGLIACGFYFDDSRRALASGIATSGGGVGMIVIPLAVNYMVNYTNFDWTGSMVFYASTSAIICLVALVMLPTSTVPSNNIDICETPRIAPVENGSKDNYVETTVSEKEVFCAPGKSWDLIKQPKLLAYCFSQGLYVIGYFIIIDYLPDMMVEDHGVSLKNAGYIIPIIGGTNSLGKFLTGLLITKLKLNPLSLNTFYLLGCGGCCIMFTFCTHYSTFLGIGALYGLLIGPIEMLIIELSLIHI